MQIPRPFAKLRRDLDAYWPRYLEHHTHRANRAMHDVGDICVILGVLTFNPLGIAAGTFAGYSCAFAGHYLIEGRRPATLEHPILAGFSNWRMFALGLSGRLEMEMNSFGLVSEGEAPWGIEALRERWFAGRQSSASESEQDARVEAPHRRAGAVA